MYKLTLLTLLTKAVLTVAYLRKNHSVNINSTSTAAASSKLNFRLELRGIADSSISDWKKQWRRNLIATNNSIDCDSTASINPLWRRYFNGVQSIYTSEKTFRNPNMVDSTCIPLHKSCGWPSITQNSGQKLPLYVLSVGLEGYVFASNIIETE